MRLFFVLSYVLASAWAGIVPWCGLKEIPAANVSALVCGLWVIAGGLLILTELGLSAFLRRPSWLWGVWAWRWRSHKLPTRKKEPGFFGIEPGAKTLEDEERELINKYEAVLRSVSESDRFGGVLKRWDGYILCKWLENLSEYERNSMPDTPDTAPFRKYSLDLLAGVYALLPVRDILTTITLMSPREDCKSIPYLKMPPVAVHPVETLTSTALSDNLAEYKRIYGEYNSRCVENDRLMDMMYAIVEKIFNLIVDAVLETCHDKNVHVAEQGLASALAEVDGWFLTNIQATAKRYIINPASLKHFATLPMFAPSNVNRVYVRCGWYAARPILFSAQVPENEVLCAYVNDYVLTGLPVIFGSDLPITLNPDGSFNVVGSVLVTRPDYIRKIVLK